MIKVNEEFLRRRSADDYVDVFEFLENLRRSGVVNMFGAEPYVKEEFPELTKQEIEKCLNLYFAEYKNIYELDE